MGFDGKLPPHVIERQEKVKAFKASLALKLGRPEGSFNPLVLKNGDSFVALMDPTLKQGRRKKRIASLRSARQAAKAPRRRRR